MPWKTQRKYKTRKSICKLLRNRPIWRDLKQSVSRAYSSLMLDMLLWVMTDNEDFIGRGCKVALASCILWFLSCWLLHDILSLFPVIFYWGPKSADATIVLICQYTGRFSFPRIDDKELSATFLLSSENEVFISSSKRTPLEEKIVSWRFKICGLGLPKETSSAETVTWVLTANLHFETKSKHTSKYDYCLNKPNSHGVTPQPLNSSTVLRNCHLKNCCKFPKWQTSKL